MSCKCENPVEALGLPSCSLIPERIKRFVFTTAVVPASNPNSGLTGGVPSSWPDPPFTPGALWRDMWKLVSPELDLVESERGDPVTETIGENNYFVRNAPRSFRGLVARPAVELEQRLRALRCLDLGVFLVDANYVLWGMRSPDNPAGDVMPIPVVRGTFYAQAEFAGVDTVYKQEFRFQIPSSVNDGDLVPIMEAKALQTYQAPMAVMGTGQWTQAGDLRVTIYSLFAQGPAANSPISIFHDGLDAYLQVQTLNNTPLAATWTQVAPGVYEATGLTPQPVQVVIPQSQWTAVWNATGRRFDFPSLRIVVRP